MRRVFLLAGVASLSWLAWAFVSGTAALLYFSAAVTALLGLLLPPALKRRRSRPAADGTAEEHEQSPVSAPAKVPADAHPLPRFRKGRAIRELEARLSLQADENHVLRAENRNVRNETRSLKEGLSAERKALRSAEEFIARERAVRQEMLIRLDRSLEQHRRERAKMEAALGSVAPNGGSAALGDPPSMFR